MAFLLNCFGLFNRRDEEDYEKSLKAASNGPFVKIYAFYFFAKMLTESQNQIGLNLLKFLNEFQEKQGQPSSPAELKNAQFCLKKMESVIRVIRTTDKMGFQEEALGPINKKLLAFSGLSVEKYVFDKVQATFLSNFGKKK